MCWDNDLSPSNALNASSWFLCAIKVYRVLSSDSRSEPGACFLGLPVFGFTLRCPGVGFAPYLISFCSFFVSRIIGVLHEYTKIGKQNRTSPIYLYGPTNKPLAKMDNQLFTRKEVAEIFRIKPRTVWKWEKKQIIAPCMYVNGKPRYSLADIKMIAAERQEAYTYSPKPTDTL